MIFLHLHRIFQKVPFIDKFQLMLISYLILDTFEKTSFLTIFVQGFRLKILHSLLLPCPTPKLFKNKKHYYHLLFIFVQIYTRSFNLRYIFQSVSYQGSCDLQYLQTIYHVEVFDARPERDDRSIFTIFFSGKQIPSSIPQPEWLQT